MPKNKQKVVVTVRFQDETGTPYDKPLSWEVAGTNDRNLLSKINSEIRRCLVSYNVSEGAKIEIFIYPAEQDQFANPER